MILEAKKEPIKGEVEKALRRAHDRVRTWVENRIDEDAKDIAQLYRSSRDVLMGRLRRIYEEYLGDEPTLVNARRTGAARRINADIEEIVNELTDYLGNHAIGATQVLLQRQPATLNKFLGKTLGPFEALPYTSQRVLDELTTTVVGGSTFFDRVGNMSDNLKSDIVKNVRTALVNGEDFETLRKAIHKTFGVDNLREPKGYSYGSVKVYKNEARRQWSELQQELAEEKEAIQVWIATLDEVTTPGCAARHGRTIESLGGISPPRHVNSIVPGTRVAGSFVGGTRRLYCGQVRELRTARGHMLTITPHHPVLTDTGMRPAYSLSEGQILVSYRDWVEKKSLVLPSSTSVIRDSGSAPEVQHVPAAIEEVFKSFPVSRRFVPITVDGNFHGDTSGWDGYVDVVAINRELLNDIILERAQDSSDFALKPEQTLQIVHVAHGSSYSLSQGPTPSSYRLPRLGELFSDDFTIIGSTFSLAPFEGLRFGLTSKLDATVFEATKQNHSRDTTFVAQLFERVPSLIAFDEIIKIRDFEFSGHVYDLQSVSGSMIANGICISNCRCTIAAYPPDSDLEVLQAEGSAWLQAHGYTRRRAMAMEAGWSWGDERLMPLHMIDVTRDGPRFRYRSVPWRELPTVMVRGSQGEWSRYANIIQVTGGEDHVLLRKAQRIEARAYSGWVPLRPSGPLTLVETAQGYALDSPVIQPPWDERFHTRAAVACFEPDGKVWAVRPRGTHIWTLPGGGVKPGETLRLAAAREMSEETGVHVMPKQLLGLLRRRRAVSAVFLGERNGDREPIQTPEELDACMPVPIGQLIDDERDLLGRLR